MAIELFQSSWFSMLAWGISIIFFTIVAGLATYLIKLAQLYDTTVIMLTKKGGGYVASIQKGGVFTDPLSKKTSFKIRGSRATMKPDSVPYLYTDKGKKIVFIANKGVKSHVFIEPSLTQKLVAKFKRAELEPHSMVTKKGFIEPRISGYDTLQLTCGIEDLTWAQREFERNVKTYGMSSIRELLPYLIWALSVMGTIVLIYILIQKFDVLANVSAQLAEAAKAIRDAKGGTVI